MTDEVVSDLSLEMIKMILLIGGPILLAGLIVGLAVSIFQAVTQINEATLSFLPKMAMVLIIILLLGPWMLDLMVNYTRDLFEQIPLLVRS